MKVLDEILLEEMQHEDHLDNMSEDFSMIDGFYPCEDEEFCNSILDDIELDNEED